MSSPQSGSGFDEALEELISLKVGFLLVLVLGPALLIGFARSVGKWCLEHQVLVTPPSAMFEIPKMDAGPDLPRLIAGCLLLIAMSALAIHSARVARRRRLQRALRQAV
ncbi:MAG: hypothetical protein M3Y49_09580 [Actinomycetota bacterium]|nr:hypothetical protein [Actinomycetota bacterium]